MKRLSSFLLALAKKLDPGLAQDTSFQYGQFNCKNCDMPFQPAINQNIKYKLCNVCFMAFDKQRITGRLWASNPQKIAQPYFYTESVQEWIEHEKGQS